MLAKHIEICALESCFFLDSNPWPPDPGYRGTLFGYDAFKKQKHVCAYLFVSTII